MTRLAPVDWSFPVPIRYGPGRVGEIGTLCRGAGIAAPLVVTDRGSRALPFVGRALETLAGARLAPALFAAVSPNPTDREAEAGKAVYEAGGHDGIVAIGGGSAMDAAKAISLIAGRDTPLWAFDFDRSPPPGGGFAPLLCVPTTAGTGAETESTGMITDTARGIKGCVWHPAHRPFAAVLDPELTVGLPRTLTAWTGCDALTHAVEAYSVPMFHPMCDGAALEALKLVGGALRRAVEAPEDLEARGAMLVGSCLAGVAFLKGLGLVHAISHMVGAAWDTHHGLTNAVLLPVVLRFNAPAIAPQVPAMAAALGFGAQDFDGFHGGICALLDALAIPRSLAAIGVCADGVADIAAKASRDPAALTNPRRASLAEIEGLIREALAAAR